MKVSVNWIRQINEMYGCAADPMPKGIDNLVEKIGGQLGAIDEVIDLGKKYDGILVARVVSCVKHPNADKLSVCLIDDGGANKKVKRNKDGLVEVVCGAPNVAAGQLIAWIPPGVTVPVTLEKEPFILEAREIRGVLSNGMIASEHELALGDDRSGILVIDKVVKPGTPFAEVYQLNDYIIDIENKMFTHRPDLFGMLGVARELAGIQGHTFKSPDWYRLDAKVPSSRARDDHKLVVKNETPKLVPRFSAAVIKDVKVSDSPAWLRVALAKVGIRPINNIVDFTNFYMLLSAQPLHAYDYDKVVAAQRPASSRQSPVASLGVRTSRKGEELTLLGGKKIKLEKGTILITAGDNPIGLGGVMGGADTEVDGKTKNIILECANFDMNTTRRTAMHYGLFTDAATRFTKGQSSLQTTAVIAKAAQDIMKLAGGRISSVIDDNHLTESARKRGNINEPVKVSTGFINSRLGLELTAPQMKKLLENVEFNVNLSGGNLTVTAPFWRTDIEIAEDIVEEIGRLYGYDHLPMELPQRDLEPARVNEFLAFKSRIRAILSAAGANEVLTYSFVHGSLITAAGQDTKDAYHIRNALSPELQYYRLSLTPSLLEKVHPNIKAGFDEFILFEIGTGHVKGVLDAEKLPKELERLSVVNASKGSKAGAPYYAAKKICDYLISELKINGVYYEPLDPNGKRRTMPYYEPLRAANIKIGDKVIGRIGEFTTVVAQALKLPKFCAGFDLHIDELMALTSLAQYQPLNRFPVISQDITLKVPSETSYQTIYEYSSQFFAQAGKTHGYKSLLEPLDIFQKSSDKTHKNITHRVTLYHPDRTLTTQEVNGLLDDLSAKIKKDLKVERV